MGGEKHCERNKLSVPKTQYSDPSLGSNTDRSIRGPAVRTFRTGKARLVQNARVECVYVERGAGDMRRVTTEPREMRTLELPTYQL